MCIMTLPCCLGPNLRYVYFNFHKECAKLRFDRLSILMDKLASDLMGKSCVCVRACVRACISESALGKTLV